MAAPVVLITGASQGIGAAIAAAFAARLPGARLALVARSRVRLAAVARRCVSLGAVAEIFPCDVTDETQVATMATAVHRRFRRVDVLVNNAGQFSGAPLLAMSVAQFDALIASNLRSVFLVTRAVVPGMIRRRRGDVFNLSSIAGLKAYPGGAGYSAAKFGVSGLSKVMREEWREQGIRVCCVYPGATWTPSWAGSGVAPRRMMPAADLARAFVDLYQLSRRTVVEEIVLRPQLGDL